MNGDDWLDEMLYFDPPGGSESSRGARSARRKVEVEVVMEHEVLHYEGVYHRVRGKRSH
jgi:hypothetical protein